MKLNFKQCANCKTDKPITEFHKRGDGFHSYCKNCRKIKLNKSQEKERKRKWYLDNKEKTIERAAKRSIENPDVVKSYKEKYYNKKESKTKAKERYDKNKVTAEFKIRSNLTMKNWRSNNKHIVAWRTLLKNSLKKLKQNKETSTFKMLGYNAEQLKLHIEGLWTPGMDWGNHGGEWHIDHIKPVYTFEKSTDVKIVNALTNLRPMWATTRIIDGVFYEGNLNRKRGFK